MSCGEVRVSGSWGAFEEGAGASVTDGSHVPCAVPVKSLRGKKVKSLFAGYGRAMVLADGFGVNWLGGPENSEAEEVTATLEELRVQHVAFGTNHSVALSLDGDLYTWGLGEGGQLGQGGTVKESPKPCPVVLRSKTTPVFIRVASGSDHVAAVTASGDVYTWGCGTSGQTGLIAKTGDRTINEKIVGAQLVPKFVANLQGIKMHRVSCGDDFTICVTDGGEVWSFGAGESGQLGTGRTTKRMEPARVIEKAANNAPFVDVACGTAHTIALTESGDCYSWGFNAYGQLGLGEGDMETRFEPVKISPPASGFQVAQIDAATHYSVALTVYHELFAWGSHYGGRLGHTEAEHKSAPSLVESLVGKEPRDVACAAGSFKDTFAASWA